MNGANDKIKERMKNILLDLRYDGEPHDNEEKNDGILRVSKSFYMNDEGVMCEITCPKGVTVGNLVGVVKVLCKERLGIPNIEFKPTSDNVNCNINGRRFILINTEKDEEVINIGCAGIVFPKNKLWFKLYFDKIANVIK